MKNSRYKSFPMLSMQMYNISELPDNMYTVQYYVHVNKQTCFVG